MRMLVLAMVVLLLPTQLLTGRSHDIFKSIQSLNSSIASDKFDLLAKIVAGINFTDDQQRTALHLAAQDGDLPAVKSLLQLGANPHLMDAQRRTPFDYVELQTQSSQLSIAYLSIASLLLEKMDGLDGVDQGGWSPMLWAIAAGDVQRVKELLDAGARFRLWGDSGIANLARRLDDQEILKTIEAYASKETPDARLLLAVETDNQPQIERLVAELVENEAVDEAFHYSVSHGHHEAAQILSEYLNDINVVLDFYGTPLQHAINAGYLELAHTLLVQRGANPNLVAQSGHSPLMDAIRLGYHDFAHTLLDYGADASYLSQGYSTSIRALNEAIMSGNLELTRRIIEVIGDVNRRTRGRLPMLIATSHGNIDMLQLLISYGGDVNIRDDHSHLSTCLHVAVCLGNIDNARLLLSYGADLNATNFTDATPLMTAVVMRQPEMVKFLLTYGADQQLVDKEGKTALDIANSARDWVVTDKEKVVKIIKLLEDGGGFTPNTPDNFFTKKVDKRLVAL